MNLLLLLSALLSALAGANGAVRAPASAQAAHLVIAAKEQATAAFRVRAVRPEQHAPSLIASAAAPLVGSVQLRAPVPLYASRRRE